MLAWGAKVNVQDKEGFTPLHLAVISGNSLIVKRLILYGADNKLKDLQGHDAYHTAMENNLDNIAEMIGRHGQFSF